MGGYRLYLLDGTGHVLSAQWLDADTDEAAVAVGRARCSAVRCEVWNGPRLVAAIEPEPDDDDPIPDRP